MTQVRPPDQRAVPEALRPIGIVPALPQLLMSTPDWMADAPPNSLLMFPNTDPNVGRSLLPLMRFLIGLSSASLMNSLRMLFVADLPRFSQSDQACADRTVSTNSPP